MDGGAVVIGETALEATEAELRRWTWHVAVTKPLIQCRRTAVAQLQARGYRTLLPMGREREVRDGRVVTVERPVFGRYLFVGVRSGQDSWAIRWVPGVQHMTLDAKRRPVIVPCAAVTAILARMEADGGVIDLCPRPCSGSGFQSGQAVRVLRGPFAGYEALFEGDQGERCRVLLSLFGGRAVAIVRADELVVA